MILHLATGNPGKGDEIRRLLAGVPGLELRDRPAGLGAPEEDGPTLLDNARIKAAAVAAATGGGAVADDTGLEVRALDGAPGVRTARYAGPVASDEDNWRKLLAELGDRDDRRATWRTIALAVLPGGGEVWAEGTCDGLIAREPRGSHGFGYDPVFVADEAGGRTFAELPVDEKNALSHRGRAFRALAVMLSPR